MAEKLFKTENNSEHCHGIWQHVRCKRFLEGNTSDIIASYLGEVKENPDAPYMDYLPTWMVKNAYKIHKGKWRSVHIPIPFVARIWELKIPNRRTI